VTFETVFEAVVAQHGERVAVEVQRADTLERWTYREVHATAAAFASRLSACGVVAGDRCALLADNDARWCAAYLAILRLGAIVVPLDTNYTAVQVSTIVMDARPRVVVVNERLHHVVHEALARSGVVQVEPLPEKTTAAAGPAPTLHDSSSPAVILYTSGTTADPKGVVLSHANLLAERDAAFSVIDVRDADSVLGVLPLFHALAQLANLLLPFAVGARVVFLETPNSSELIRALNDRGITIFACVPQFFYLIHERILAEVARGGVVKRVGFRTLMGANLRLRRTGMNLGRFLFARVHRLLGPQMRLFVTGGSKFDPVVGRDFYALGFTILQAYGLTETSGAATITRPDEAGLDTVGRVFAGHDLRIMPPDGPELDGEIAIRGPIVMRGYYNRPDATAAVMCGGWLLTGDLGRLDHAGRLTITGRKKEVIVLASGKNIYPEEIEAQYQQSAYVKEICVMGLTRDEDPTTERLYAVVIPDMALMRERRIANAGDLLRFEIEGQSIHLPPHKRVLGYEIWFEPLPRTTTGKLKRHEIAARVRRRRREAAARTAASAATDYWPDDPHASAAVNVIRGRCKTTAIAPEAYLELDLGLDSMERVELIGDLEHRFGVRVPEARAHDILTVQQLIEAVRPGAGPAVPAATEPSWSTLFATVSPGDAMVEPLLRKRRVTPLLFYVALRLARLLLPRVVVSGREHLPAQGPYIVSPNHQSYLDPLFLCSALPYGVVKQLFFVGAAEYFETPITAWIARQLSLLPVDPDANLVPAMKAGAFGLSRGRILVLFPEGERSIDGTVKRFKKGAPILSRHLTVPIVPVAIHGVYELWPRNRPFAWTRIRPWGDHRVRIAFGSPLQVSQDMTDAEGATALHDRVAAMWQGLDRSPQDGREHGRTGDGAAEENRHLGHLADENESGRRQ
jgi:long-chain acyl-CoA synthetase